MADTKISDLTQTSGLGESDAFPLAVGGANYKAYLSDIRRDLLQFLAASIPIDDWYFGVSTKVNYGASIVAGDVLYVDTADNEHKLADADAATTGPCRVIAIEAGSDSDTNKKVMVFGLFRHDAWNWTPGATLYLSTTAGDMTETAPSGAGDQVQILGWAVTADVVFFFPQLVIVEIAS